MATLIQKQHMQIAAEHKHKNIFAVELSNHIWFTIFAVLIAAVLIILAKEYLFAPSAEGSSDFRKYV